VQLDPSILISKADNREKYTTGNSLQTVCTVVFICAEHVSPEEPEGWGETPKEEIS
jgi:hypothetical protein